MRFVCAFLAAWALSGAARADSLDAAIQREADAIVRKLLDDGHRTAGVLKFLVFQEADEKLTDRAGPINSTLARRLELALILSNENHPTDPKRQLRVIRDASAVAESLGGATHRTEAGRKELLAAEYPLAWGREKARPDVLLTGYARVSRNSESLRITVHAFSDAKELQALTRFDASADPPALIELGRSFQLRDVFGGGELAPQKVQDEAIKAAEKIRRGEEKHPATPGAETPVALTVLYNGRPVAIEVRDGEARIPEPDEHQTVKFVLERKGKERYAAVLKVNGENTLYRQRLRDEDCSKWILGPDSGPVTIAGFQKGTNKAEEFKVLSRAESKGLEVDYGKDVGTISLTVFGERNAPEKKLTISDDELDRIVMQRGDYPEKPAEDLQSLKEKLRRVKPAAERGLIVAGREITVEVEKTTFNLDRTPLFSATIRYYKPQK